MFNPFATLGLSPETATLDDARRQYRALAKTHHPDRGGDAVTMSLITRAWRDLQTQEKLEEVARILLARQSTAVRNPSKDAHMHDVRTSDGVVYLGPYTKGACAKEADCVIEELARQHRVFILKAALTGRWNRFRKADAAPAVLIPHAFSLTAERIYFYCDDVVVAGPALLCIPAMRRDEAGVIGYSGMAAQSLLLDIPQDGPGLIGLGQTLVRGDDPPDAVLVFEGGQV